MGWGSCSGRSDGLCACVQAFARRASVIGCAWGGVVCVDHPQANTRVGYNSFIILQYTTECEIR